VVPVLACLRAYDWMRLTPGYRADGQAKQAASSTTGDGIRLSWSYKEIDLRS